MTIHAMGDEWLPLNTDLKQAIDAWPPSELERLASLHRTGAPLRLPAESRQNLVDVLVKARGSSGV